MLKAEFNEIVKDGLSRGRNFMVVKIETEGNPGSEIIVNPAENFNQKIKYYNNAYNDNMELIKAKEAGKLIKITDAIFTSNLNDLSWFVY